MVDHLVAQFLATAAERIDYVAKGLRMIDSIVVEGESGLHMSDWLRSKFGLPKELTLSEGIKQVQAAWQTENEIEKSKRESECFDTEERIKHIGELLTDHRLPKILQAQYWREIEELQSRHESFMSTTLSPLERLSEIQNGIEELSNGMNSLKGELFGQLVTSVSAKHELRDQKNGTVSKLVGFEVQIAENWRQSLGESQIFDTPTDMDSLQRPASHLLETSRCPSHARS